MAGRKQSFLEFILCSSDREPSRFFRSSRRRKSYPFLYSLFGTYPDTEKSAARRKVPLKPLTKILGRKTWSAKESLDNLAMGSRKLWGKARQRVFPRATVSKQFYLQEARVSSSSVNPIDDLISGIVSLAVTDVAAVGNSPSIELIEQPLETIVHPAKDNVEKSHITSRKPRKSILKPRRDDVFAQSELATTEADTIANTSLNLLVSFRQSTLKTRASTGSLHSRMRRNALSQHPLSPNQVQKTLAGILATVTNEYRPSNPGCHCLQGCTCRILERYFLNKFPEEIDPVVGQQKGKRAVKKNPSKTVRFDHAHVYPIEDIEDSDDEWALYTDFSWLDQLEKDLRRYGADFADCPRSVAD
ncbi:hypothetical protein PRK78_002937 [Emydomyces testavorans]|uniref:Uncharacterized protein n=1 Tax=Emydomyces testavorans TaxID=2070801 RepID=A0AAF0DGR0_9EURO|nr:hypothetical protein PRK78_002937 [Emydomyces testavorans]